MSRIRVLVALAVGFAACRGASGCGGKESAPKAAAATVSAMGVVSGVQPDKVQVKTDDGRQLALQMSDSVKVTLAGGEAQSAVITEGAPVRVSYKPKGDGGELVSVDVEPKSRGGGEQETGSAAGEQKPAPQRDVPADGGRVRQGG